MASRFSPRPAVPARWWVSLLGGGLLAAQAGCAAGPLTLSLAPPFLSATPASSVLWMEPFEALDPQRWRNVEVKGRTQYDVVALDGQSCLRARSHEAASILVHRIRYDPDTYAGLSWQWRVDQLVDGEDLARKDGSDAAARVYVYFESRGLPWQQQNIDYVWSRSLPVGTVLNSAYAANSKILVVDSGSDALGTWRAVLRDIGQDYERCFHHHAPHVVAIGVMSDTDNTQGQALAYFDDVMVSRSSAASVPASATSQEPAGRADRGPSEITQE